jgi:hypothetical protein
MAARLRELVEHQVRGRLIAVHLSRSMERRLVRHGESVNRDMPDDPLNLSHDADLAIILLGAADEGLRAGETDDGVWSALDGRSYHLPRPVRAPWRMRLGIAAKAAITAWRAS